MREFITWAVDGFNVDGEPETHYLWWLAGEWMWYWYVPKRNSRKLPDKLPRHFLRNAGEPYQVVIQFTEEVFKVERL